MNENSTAKSIDKLFENLSQWKKLPKYEFERRVDAFFGLYLDVILLAVYGGKWDIVAPEFPYIKECQFNWNPSHIDYLIRENNKYYLLELKTDVNSKTDPHGVEQEKQMKYVVSNSNLAISNLKTIYSKTKSESRPKYEALFGRLIECGAISVESKNQYMLYSQAQVKDFKLENYIYIQPKLTYNDKLEKNKLIITFDDILNKREFMLKEKPGDYLLEKFIDMIAKINI